MRWDAGREAHDRVSSDAVGQGHGSGARQLHGQRVIAVDVHVENFGGHKLPTAFPSRRAWLHVMVKDASGRLVFESGALKPDGSIAGNDND